MQRTPRRMNRKMAPRKAERHSGECDCQAPRQREDARRAGIGLRPLAPVFGAGDGRPPAAQPGRLRKAPFQPGAECTISVLRRAGQGGRRQPLRAGTGRRGLLIRQGGRRQSFGADAGGSGQISIIHDERSFSYARIYVSGVPALPYARETRGVRKAPPAKENCRKGLIFSNPTL